MLLRSSSSPLLKSTWVVAGKEAAAHEFQSGGAELAVIPLSRTRSVAHLTPCLSCSCSSFGSSPSASSPSARGRLVATISRVLSEGDLSNPRPRAAPFAPGGLSSFSLEESGEADEDQVFLKIPRSSSLSSPSFSWGRLLSSSGLDEGGLVVAEGADGCSVATGVVSDGCAGGRDGGGKICGGGRGRRGGGENGDGDGGFDVSDPDSGNDATDLYYLQMIEANPGNSLILGNYAKFLIGVRGDLVKSQEYCERAIVANPGDAAVLALYADLVWQSSRDAPRAEGYFDRAIQAAPEDCYIMASFARFLWDAEEEEETDEARESSNSTPLPLVQGTTLPPIAATS